MTTRSAATAASSLVAHRFGGIALTWSDAAALLAVVLWGLNFPITKQLMVATDPLAVTFLRAALSALVFAAILTFSRQWKLPKARDIGRIVVVGLIGMTLNAVLYAYGLHLTTASHSGLIFTVTPLLVFVTSHVLGLLRLTRKDVLGLSIGLVGAAVIVGAPLLSGGESGASLLGDLLTVGAAVTWGAWMLLAAPLLRRYDTLNVTSWITMVGVVGLFPLALPGLLAHNWTQVSLPEVGGLLYSGIFAGAVGGLLWYGAMRQIGAARTIVYANMESFFVVLFAALLLSERVEWTALVGGLAIVAGVLLTRHRGASASS